MNNQITVADILDLIDPNRSGWQQINLFEYKADEAYSTLRTDSIALDMISDRAVDSLGCDNGHISIFLNDEDVEGYWTNNLVRAQEKAAQLQQEERQ